MKVIFSLTTSPTRIGLISNVIESMMNQTVTPDLIRINIPKIFKRTGLRYEIPSFLTNNPKVKIVEYSEDCGPLMKVIPTIDEEKSSIVIYTDDDVLLLPKTIETYLKYLSINPNFVYCLTGFNFNGHNQWTNFEKTAFVTVPEGYMSVCLNPVVIDKFSSFADYYKVISQDECCVASDDLILGNFLALNKIYVYKIYDEFANYDLWWSSGCELMYGTLGDALKYLNGGNYSRYNKAYDFLVRNKLRGLKA